MSRLKVAMVSYLNAIPFKYGIDKLCKETTDLIELDPASCASLFFDHKVDVALLPVGALVGHKNYTIFSDYCIGSIGEVQTVCLFSNNLIADIHTVYLDIHSKTSILLTKLLLKETSSINIVYKYSDTEELELSKGEAKLMIGDKVFRNKTNYKHVIDLSSWWHDLTGLPFVFAVWVKRNNISTQTIDRFEDALAYGVNHLKEVLDTIDSDVDLNYYFKHNISYHYDVKKKEGLSLFWEKIKNFIIL